MNLFCKRLKCYIPYLGTLLLLISCQNDLDTLVISADQSEALADPLDETPIKILSYNTFLLRNTAVVSTTQWSQTERAEKLAEADFMQHYDALLLQECFDPTASNLLRQKLSATYPYQTPILGSTRTAWDKTSGDWREITDGGFSNGGVMIASQYPIEYQEQYIFPMGCGLESLALKGFVYARIVKEGKPIHLIATHLQSTQPDCRGDETNVRTQQLRLIKSYIDQRAIPANETVIYGGDFNVVKDSPEYREMLNTLSVNIPQYKGLAYSWDNKTNTLASYHYPFPETQPEHLDYIFISKNHKKPSSWQNITFDPVSTTWMTYSNLVGDNYYWVDYSDHYPVEGTIVPDEYTAKRSLKTRNYDRISLQSVATGKYISSNLSSPNDWLTITSAEPSNATWFNLANMHDDADYFDLVEGKVRVESSERLNNFWYWQALNSKPYYYYPNHALALKTLELVRVSTASDQPLTSIQDGDVVAFRDYSLIGKAYYLQVSRQAGIDRLYLNGNNIGISEQFVIRFSNEPSESWL